MIRFQVVRDGDVVNEFTAQFVELGDREELVHTAIVDHRLNVWFDEIAFLLPENDFEDGKDWVP